MSDIETRCRVYNIAHGTSLTPKQYYKLGTDEIAEAEKVPQRTLYATTSIEKNVKNKIMRKL